MLKKTEYVENITLDSDGKKVIPEAVNTDAKVAALINTEKTAIKNNFYANDEELRNTDLQIAGGTFVVVETRTKNGGKSKFDVPAQYTKAAAKASEDDDEEETKEGE